MAANRFGILTTPLDTCPRKKSSKFPTFKRKKSSRDAFKILKFFLSKNFRSNDQFSFVVLFQDGGDGLSNNDQPAEKSIRRPPRMSSPGSPRSAGKTGLITLNRLFWQENFLETGQNERRNGFSVEIQDGRPSMVLAGLNFRKDEKC